MTRFSEVTSAPSPARRRACGPNTGTAAANLLGGLYARGMAEKDKASGMKSAYELALERMESQGIERPREESLSEDVRARMGEARRQAEAKLAELEILHQNRLKTVWEPDKRQEAEEEYVRERRRIEAERDKKIEKLRK